MLWAYHLLDIAFGEQQASPSTNTNPSIIGFDQFLLERGYTAAVSSPLITEHAFNGGLTYDENHNTLSPKTFVKQRAARVEDVDEKQKPGTLPIFTIIGLDTSTPDLTKTATNLILEYLIKIVGLDADRLRVTTTEHSSKFFPLLASWGIPVQHIRLQTWAAAVKSGAGSGYFAPAGHPDAPNAPSFSLEYLMPDGKDLEIAEITHADGTGRSGGGPGVERVEMARTGRYLYWVDLLPQFNLEVQKEAEYSGKNLPQGVAAINYQ